MSTHAPPPPARPTTRIWLLTAAAALLVVIAYAALAATGQEQRAEMAREDGIIQPIGATGLLLAAVFFFLAFRRTRRTRRPDESRLKPLVLLGLAVMFFLAGGEELSWGQHIFGWSTPEGLREINRQEETNLHNLGSIYGLDEYRVFTLFWFPFVLLLPLLAAAWKPARTVMGRYLPLVAWPLGLLFILNDATSVAVGRTLTEGVAQFGPTYEQWRIELRETVFGVLCALIAFTLAAAAARRRVPHEAPAGVGAPSRRAPSRAGEDELPAAAARGAARS